MTTSDSEAYESADEDLKEESSVNTALRKVVSIDEVRSQHSEHIETVETKSSASGQSPDVPHESNAQKAIKRQEKERKPKEVVKLGVKVDKSNSEVKSQHISNSTFQGDDPPHDTTKSDDGWEDFDVETTEIDQGIISDSVEDKVLEVKEKTSTSKECDEGWDFDDWGDEDVQSHVASKPETPHSEQEFKYLADKLSSLGNVGTKIPAAQSGWGGWGEWGASLITSGVSQLTTHVSQGFNTVSNVIESGIGAPDPEELVRIQKESRLRREEQVRKNMPQENSIQKEDDGETGMGKNQENVGGFQLGRLVSSVTKLVETTGSTVITGGLDTLEEIGKRTMKVIQGDESGGRVKLSTLLREAKDRKEEQDTNAECGDFIMRKSPRFEVLFDDYQGLVHLEALEMLSKQCDIKIQTLATKYQGNELKEFQETLEQVKEICELPDYDDDFDNKHDIESFHQRLVNATKDLGIPLSFEPILVCWKELFEDVNKSKEISLDTKPSQDNSDDIEDISCLAMKNMAQFSALSVQLLHKCAALLSVRERRSTADEADGLTQLTAILSHHIGEIANIYTNKLNELTKQCNSPDKASTAMTSIFFEAEKGSSYVKDAFLLTIPILQVGAT